VSLPPVTTVTVLSTGKVIGLNDGTAIYSMGSLRSGDCIYSTCRARNLCREGHCVGRNLQAHGYNIENGRVVNGSG